MTEIIEATGYFFWPLALCLLLGAFITFERLFALRSSRVLPDRLIQGFVTGEVDKLREDLNTSGGRIVAFYKNNHPDPAALKAYAGLEITRLERGMFILDLVVSAAPLIGLLGTVAGLISVFTRLNPDTAMPDPSTFVSGIALALYTTMLGLAIAIPAMVANSYLSRRIDALAAKIDVGVERLIDLSRHSPPRMDKQDEAAKA